MIFFWKNSVNFWHGKLILKVRFRHFLRNHNSWQDCFMKISFDHVDSWAKILHFRTHHLNSTTELTLPYIVLERFQEIKTCSPESGLTPTPSKFQDKSSLQWQLVHWYQMLNVFAYPIVYWLKESNSNININI